MGALHLDLVVWGVRFSYHRGWGWGGRYVWFYGGVWVWGCALSVSRIACLAVVGSRSFPDLALVVEQLGLVAGRIDRLVSGGAPGVDRCAERWATSRGIPVTVYPARWEQLGRSAGVVRNADIVAAASELWAFWDGKSRGTADSIRRARARGIPVRVFSPATAVQLGLWS